MSRVSNPFNLQGFLPFGRRAPTPLGRRRPIGGNVGPESAGGGLGIGELQARLAGRAESRARRAAGPRGVDVLEAAAARDISEQETAISEQEARRNEVIGRIAGLGEGLPGAIEQGARAALTRLGGFEGELAGLAEAGIEETGAAAERATGALRERTAAEIEDLQTLREDVMGRVEQLGGRAIASAKRAEATARGAVSALAQRETEILSATVDSAMARFEDSLKLIRGGIRADGTLMSPAELAAARRDTEFDVQRTLAQTGAQISGTFAQLIDQARARVAAAQQVTAQVTQDVARTKLGAAAEARGISQMIAGLAGQEAQTELAAGELRQQSRQVALGFGQARAAIQQSMAQIDQLSRLGAVQAQLDNQNNLFRLISENPPTVVSRLAALTQLFALRAAPGARRVRFGSAVTGRAS